jgi:hypothetical protein
VRSGSRVPVGMTTVTCQVSDGDDATPTVITTFHVTVTDTDLALKGVPADIAVTAPSQSGAVVDYAIPTALDEDGSQPLVTCSPTSGSTFPQGTTAVSCGTTDPDDVPSTFTATFKVTVNDSDLTFSGAPSDGAVDATGPSGAVVNYTLPVAADEDASTTLVTCQPASGSTFRIGTTTVSCSAFDGDDTPSSTTATFHVTVNDTDLALSGVPANTTTDATSHSGATVNYPIPTAVDEEAGVPAVSCDHPPGSTFPIGMTTVTCQVSDSDDSPSSVSSSFLVTVKDTDLFFNGPGDITAVATSAAGAAVTYPMPTASDEEGSPIVTCDHASGSIFPVGVMTLVSCSVSDSDDSPSTQTFGFFISVIPDMQLGVTIDPTTVTGRSTVITAAAVTNIGSVSRKVSLAYMVTFTDGFGTTTTVASDKATVTCGSGQTVTRAFSFMVKNGTPGGTYTVTVTSTDVTGSVTQTGTFDVT